MTLTLIMRDLLLFLLPLFLLTSCGGSSDPAGSDAIMPLAVGNRWMARVTTWDSAGSVTATRNDSIVIDRSERRNDLDYYIDGTGLQYANMARGLWKTYPGGCCADIQALYPAQPLDTFATLRSAVLLHDTLVVEQIVATQVVSVDTSITVPAGTFRCHHYRLTLLAPTTAQLRQSSSTFYAPGVGPVMTERRMAESGSTPGRPIERWELLSYHLN